MGVMKYQITLKINQNDAKYGSKLNKSHKLCDQGIKQMTANDEPQKLKKT